MKVVRRVVAHHALASSAFIAPYMACCTTPSSASTSATPSKTGRLPRQSPNQPRSTLMAGMVPKLPGVAPIGLVRNDLKNSRPMSREINVPIQERRSVRGTSP